MHDIEPHYAWREHYVASEDERSPFYGRTYSEFHFSNTIYNYYIHPQWDHFGSSTLYLKILFADYQEGFAIIEMIGEWNDCLQNDIMILKQEIIDPLQKEGISKFIMVCENVLNFHGSDDCYYEEWHEEALEEGGWIVLLNTLNHVKDEFFDTQLHFFLNFGEQFNNVNWRPQKPKILYQAIDALVEGKIKELMY